MTERDALRSDLICMALGIMLGIGLSLYAATLFFDGCTTVPLKRGQSTVCWRAK